MSTQGKAIIWGSVGFVAGIVLFFKGFSWLKLKRLIENIPTSKIRSIAMGLVEVHGKVQKGLEPLKSPMSNKECVYYKYTIEEYRKQGKNSRWVTLKHDTRETPFYLKDDTGKVLVNPRGANIEIPIDFEHKSSWGKDPPATIKNFLNKVNINFEGFLGINRTMRYREYYIAPDDNLYVIGTADDNPMVDEATAVKGVDDVMIKKGKQKVFYISDKPEHQVIKSLKWRSFGSIIGGAILSIVCLIIVLAALGLF